MKSKQDLENCINIIEVIRHEINSRKCAYCLSCKYLKELHEKINTLVISIQNEYPAEADKLKLYLSGLIGVNQVNPYDFGGIIAVVGILKNKMDMDTNRLSNFHTTLNTKKVFISHSSEDKQIISSFCKDILRLGCGLQTEDIVCTSIESSAIKTGTDIRNYLKEQLVKCEYVFFMISDNYIKSNICLNEMGAAWILEKKVKPFLFPNKNYKEMGWLYEISKGGKLDDETTLDELRDELLQRYQQIKTPNTVDWTLQKRSFLKTIQNPHEKILQDEILFIS